MNKLMFGLIVCCPITANAAVLQDCPAGPADQILELSQDTIPVRVGDAFSGVESLLADLGYEVELADAETGLLRTIPVARRPVLSIMDRYAEYDPPLIQLAVALTSTGDSSATVVTLGTLALCRVAGDSPSGVETPIESIFEVAAGAEFANALYASRDRFASGAINQTTPPRRMSCPIPDFPDYVLRELTTMDIELTFIVGPDGLVQRESIEISRRTSPAVQDAVRDAMIACRFRPALENGVPVAAPYTYRMVLRRR